MHVVLGHPVVDSQHGLLFGIIDNLRRYRIGGEVNVPWQDLLEQLEAYMVFHFTTEERLMAEAGYPHINEHRQLHHSALEAVRQFEAELSENSFLPAEPVDQFLDRWVQEHIGGVDRRMVEFLLAHPAP